MDQQQQQRLDYLVEEFKKDSGEYSNIETPADTEGKRILLRSLMNVRMPRRIEPDILKIQDAYLLQRSREIGIIDPAEIRTVREAGSSVRHGEALCIWQGDITRLAADAIVNAANSQMLGCFVPMHSCIDNCIHTFAGVQLRAECARQMDQLRRKFGADYEQPTGVPMLTPGYNLPAKHVIHIVGPIVAYQLTDELEQDLASCYRNTMDLCAENSFDSVAFCCISTGVFRFPGRRAAEIAVAAVSDWLDRNPSWHGRVIFNVFKDEDRIYYEHQLL